MKIIAILCGACLLIWGANELYQKKTRYGLIAKFSSPTFISSQEWTLPPLPEAEQQTVDQILSQKFTYLARGSQAFAFISEDKKYILKLFKQHKWHPKNIFGYISLPFNPYYEDYLHRQRKQFELLHSCKTALSHIKEDTGVLYAHLNPTPLFLPQMRIIDKHGKSWKLNLDKSCFLLQKKADLFYPHLQQMMARRDLEGAKYAITSTFKLLDRFIEMGVFENNAILRKNFGFIDNEAIQFDIGKFKFDPDHRLDKSEIRIITERFHHWIIKNYPELLPHFDQKLDEYCPIF